MMPNLLEVLLGKSEPLKPLPPGMVSYHTPPEAEPQYRLHLRIEPDGEGVLIVNASSILHLNQTATEMIWHFIQGHTEQETSTQISKRYKVSPSVIQQDLQQFKNQLFNFILKKDQEPVSSFGFEPHYNLDHLSAPYRLDCGLTYRTDADQKPENELNTQQWKVLIEKASQAGIPHLIYFGGEPTLRNDLVEILEYTEELGLVSGLVSNSEKIYDDAYISALINAGLDHIMIPAGSTRKLVLENLQRVADKDLYTCVHFDVDDAHDFGATLQELTDMGVNAFSLLPASDELLSITQDLAAFVEQEQLVLVDDMPLPYAHPSRALRMQEGSISHPDEEFVYLQLDPSGNLRSRDGHHLGHLLNESFESIWARRHQNSR
jgi:hypothetical protein